MIQQIPGISAIIPAAGLSTRMHKYKPLLKLGNLTIVEQTITILKKSGINDVIVVTGHNREQIEPVIQRTGARPVFNKNFKTGMLGSIKTGVNALFSQCNGFLLLPVDIPLIRSSSIKTVISAFNKTCKHIIIPQFNGEPGHPPVIPAWLIPQILNLEKDSNLGSLLFSLKQHIKKQAIHDQGIVMDADTQDAYEKLKEKHRSIDIPNKKECYSIIQANLQKERNIQSHVKLVAKTAITLAMAVQKKIDKKDRQSLDFNPNLNMDLNLDLIHAGALLHDIKRKEANHATKGAGYLLSLEFPEVANIVAQHMDLTLPLSEHLTEIQIVYFADKLCNGANIELDYSKRFNEKIRQTQNSKIDTKNIILQRYKHTQLIQTKIENICNKSVKSILQDNSDKLKTDIY